MAHSSPSKGTRRTSAAPERKSVAPLKALDRISFRFAPTGTLATELRQRARDGEESLRARGDLARYYALLRSALPLPFSEDEAQAIACANNGGGFEHFLDEHAGTPAQFHGSILASLYEHLAPGPYGAAAEHAGVDAQQLGEKIRGLDRIQSLALQDALERFWADPTVTLEAAGLCGRRSHPIASRTS